MNAKFSQFLLIAVVIVSGGVASEASAQYRPCFRSRTAYIQPAKPKPAPVTPEPETATVVQLTVQAAPVYEPRCQQVFSGARVTLYGDFLGREPGAALFEIGGTSHECELLDWQNRSVTIDLPRLGLLEPKYAEIKLVRADGRIAKTFKILYVSQPDIVQHEESIPQSLPPAPVPTAPACYITAISGGVTLTAQ